MKKVLIYFPINRLIPKGGPAGYLNNLYTELQKSYKDSETVFEFLPSETALTDNKGLRDSMPKRVRDVYRALRFTKLLSKQKPAPDNLDSYDAIHFHSTETMYYCRKWLEDYKGKVVLTSHSPCIYHQELIGRLNPFDYKLLKSKLDKLEQMDIYAFTRADYIVFPCEEAEEPYYNTWDKYKSIRKAEKYRYMTTGIVGCNAKVDRQNYREKYNIPNDAFVVSYAGRHNEIKGYADLKKIGKDLLRDKNVYFLIAGREEPMKGLKDDRWIEVGWTNDPHSLIASSDVFVLPNRETYFDLILLEVMSLGVPIVLSNTGGNKYFKKYNLDGMKFYSTLDEAKSALCELKSMPKDKLKNAGEQNKDVFSGEFSVEKFTERYVNVIADILSDGGNR